MVRISSETYEYVTQIETELFPEPDPFANFDANDAYNSGTYTEPAYQAPAPSQQYGQRIDDGLGHYSDDGGATWMNYSGGAYQEPAPAFDPNNDPYFGNFDAGAAENLAPSQTPSFQQNEQFQGGLDYLGDLSGGGVYEEPGTGNQFYDGNWYDRSNNIYNEHTGTWQTPEEYRQYWDAIMQHDNAVPVEQGGYQWSPFTDSPENVRARFQDFDLQAPNFDEPQNARARFQDFDLYQPEELSWWEKGLGKAGQAVGAVGDFIPDVVKSGVQGGLGSAIGGPATAAFSQATGYGFGDAFNDYNEYVGNPLAETGAQFTPFLNAAAAPGGFATGEIASRFGLGNSPSESMGAGLREFGDAVMDSGGNPIDFASAQNENFSERPMWQQFGAQALFDPTNLAPGIGAIKYGPDAVRGLADLGDEAVQGVRALGQTDTAGRVGAFLADETGSVSLSGKTIPGLFDVGEQAAEVGTRPGSLLNPRGIDQLGDYSVDDALKVARDLDRQRGSVTNTLMAEADAAFRALGKTTTDENGNVFFRAVAPSPAEIDAGLNGALATRVIERPGEYALTPIQQNAVETIARIESKVANERELFGVPVDRMALEEGEQYMHRLATKPSTGTQVNALLDEGADSVSLTGRGGGKRLGGGRDKSRLYDDPLQAVTDGVVYAHPKQALRESIEANLKKAGDAHVKSLLTPFAQTASDRIPQALRVEVTKAKTIAARLERRLATAEKRAGIKASEGESLARMFEAQATGAKLATDAPTPDVQTVNRFIQRAQRRITALRQRGGAFEDDARALTDMLDDARLRVADVMPQWEQAKELARNVPAGRATVPQELAPALIGSDFTAKDAARIRAHLSGGIRVGDKVMNTNIPGVKVLNSVLVPLNAIGDASSTLNQLAMAGATHRGAFVKNFGKVLRDMVDDSNYYKWESAAKAKDAAKHGVAIMGESGARQDFQFGTWVSKVPVLKQTQTHFTRFGNRMRVDAYNSVIDTAKRSGQELDDLAKERAARAVNRLTGISNSRATDVETLAQFAPNWLRSNIENVAKAATDGSLEGQLARQYMKNYVALGSALVAGAALAADRDLSEVLTPLDEKALKRGEIRLNPNFMTVRVAGQDIGIFGAYDSLARLITLGADSTYRSLRDQDAKQLFDFVGYAASTKGSPLVKFATDLIKGETFTGEDPLSLSATAKRFMPFTASNVVEGVQQGKSGKDIALDAGLGFFGAKSNPMSLSEKLNEAAGGDFWSMDKEAREAILSANPELRAQVDRSDKKRLEDAIKDRDIEAEKPIGFEELKQVDVRRLENEKKAAEKFTDNRNIEEFRKRLDDIQFAAAVERGQLDRDFKLFKETGELPADPLKAAVTQYYAVYDRNRIAGVDLDFDKVQRELAALEKTWTPEQKAHVKIETNDTVHDPMAQKIYDAKATVRDLGYWDINDKVFTIWAAQSGAPVAPGQSSDEFFDTIEDKIYERLRPTAKSDTEAILLTDKAMDKVTKDYDDLVSKARKAVREGDPTLMRALIVAGYYTPGKELTGDLVEAGVLAE
jgi:hypothetical protein